MNFWVKKLKLATPILSYMVVYFTWFFILENRNTAYKLIHTSIDDRIPFCEYFVIPYYLWFLYVTFSILLPLFTDEDAYKKTIVYYITGMTVFLLISTIWPNGHNLRPVIPEDNSIFTKLVSSLYKVDTPTNIWPSIHVYNSIGAHLAVTNCSVTRNKFWARALSLVLCVSIIFSTMFLKQHSFFDVCTAFMMALLFGLIVYRNEAVEAVRELSSGKRLYRRLFKTHG